MKKVRLLFLKIRCFENAGIENIKFSCTVLFQVDGE